MISMSATVDGAASAAFQAALTALRDSLGEASSTAPRQAALNICDKFKANTKSAKKYAPKEDYVIVKSMARPDAQYITKKDGRVLRRFMLIRPPRGISYDVYAKNPAEVRKERLILVRRGLAKRSWGWCAYNIWHGRKSDDIWERRRRDKRDPKDATKESTSSATKGVTEVSGSARICNRLDYASAALTCSVDEVVRKAANVIVYNLARKRIRKAANGGMSADEIKAAAEQVAHDFKHSFTT